MKAYSLVILFLLSLLSCQKNELAEVTLDPNPIAGNEEVPLILKQVSKWYLAGRYHKAAVVGYNPDFPVDKENVWGIIVYREDEVIFKQQAFHFDDFEAGFAEHQYSIGLVDVYGKVTEKKLEVIF